jgi:putative Mn2+ efflux pump MntP
MGVSAKDKPMPFVLVLGLAVALAMDCFAVSMGLACGLEGLSTRQSIRMAFFFGAFQFVMPVAGSFAGVRIVRFMEGFDHWIAFGLLAAIGGRMIYESFSLSDEEKARRPDPTSGVRLLVLSIATSIDALAVGLSLGVIKAGILFPAAVIGVVCFTMTIVGARLGPVVGRVAGRRAELLGGLILIAIGARILFVHLRG